MSPTGKSVPSKMSLPMRLEPRLEASCCSTIDSTVGVTGGHLPPAWTAPRQSRKWSERGLITESQHRQSLRWPNRERCGDRCGSGHEMAHTRALSGSPYRSGNRSRRRRGRSGLSPASWAGMGWPDATQDRPIRSVAIGTRGRSVSTAADPTAEDPAMRLTDGGDAAQSTPHLEDEMKEFAGSSILAVAPGDPFDIHTFSGLSAIYLAHVQRRSVQVTGVSTADLTWTDVLGGAIDPRAALAKLPLPQRFRTRRPKVRPGSVLVQRWLPACVKEVRSTSPRLRFHGPMLCRSALTLSQMLRESTSIA